MATDTDDQQQIASIVLSVVFHFGVIYLTWLPKAHSLSNLDPKDGYVLGLNYVIV